MTTICTDCGKRIESRFEILEGIKTIMHLREHPELRELYHQNQERVTECVSLEDGSVVHIIGENISYEDDEEKVVELVD